MARYKEAVQWIAYNDEPSETDPNAMSGLISVVMVADLWDKDAGDVAREVVAIRYKANRDKMRALLAAGAVGPSISDAD